MLLSTAARPMGTRWLWSRRRPVADTPTTATTTAEPIDLNELVSAVQRASNGAVVLFVGTVRDINEGRQVTGIRYDAYREMAEGVLGEIITEAASNAGIAVIEATHRIGELS